MRISSQSIINSIAHSIRTVRTEYEKKQVQISLGRKYEKRSDAPVSAAHASRLEREGSAQAQWSLNIGVAQTWAQVSESSLDRLLDCLQRSKELAVQANDATQPDGNLSILAEEINGILEDVLMTTNTTFADGYLFAGTAAATQPVTATRIDGRITAVAYENSGLRRKVQMGATATVEYGYTTSGRGGVFADPAAGVDILQVLIDFRDELEVGAGPSAGTLQDLQDGLEHVLSKVTENGIDQRRLKGLEDNASEVDDAITVRLAEVRDVDLAEALIELNDLQFSLEASLQMAVRINQLSLLDFI